MDSKKKMLLDLLPIILFIVSVINLLLCSFIGIVSLIVSILITIWTLINIKKKDILYIVSLFISVASIIIFVFVNYVGLSNINGELGLSKEDEFVEVATKAVSVAKDDYLYNKYKNTKCYTVEDINRLDSKFKLEFSPDGVKYSNTSFIKIYLDANGVVGSSICLVDDNNNGFNYIDQNSIDNDKLNIGDADLCIMPSDCQ